MQYHPVSVSPTTLRRNTSNLNELMSIRSDLTHLIYWMKHDPSLNANLSNLASLNNLLRDTGRQIRDLERVRRTTRRIM